MDLPSLKDAIDVYQAQIEIIDNLWTVFATATLGVLGFTIGSDKATRSGVEVTIIILGYVAFAVFGNLMALMAAYSDLLEYHKLVGHRVAALKGSIPALSLKVLPTWGVLVFHLGIVAAVSIAIFATFRAKKAAV